MHQVVTRSVADLNTLRLEHRAVPGQPFYAAGAPWFLTLFGRDSLWAARLARALSPATAASTLRVLAALQGQRYDPITEEAPGKILHEVRGAAFSILPANYFGTVDATSLWVCLLVELWRDNQLTQPEEWLDPLQAALDWITGPAADPDGDGVLEYASPADGRGLANQGWKDSGDAIRFADGTRADGPIALCEVQGYAYQAVCGGADLLHRLGTPAQRVAADRQRSWADQLRSRFNRRFLLPNGLPAFALDGTKKLVDATTSNIGHLLGTGILAPQQERQIAERLLEPDMSSGLGLRTMSSLDVGFNPLSYHCGSVWAHDTAIAIHAMTTAGLHQHASRLARQLLSAAEHFEYQLPELWSGHANHAIPYPAACRPQAWAAAAAFPAANALSSHHSSSHSSYRSSAIGMNARYHASHDPPCRHR